MASVLGKKDISLIAAAAGPLKPAALQFLIDCLRRAEAAQSNSRTVNAAIPSQLVAFGAAPAANTVGYSNSGVNASGYTMLPWADAVTNAAPAQGGAMAAKPLRIYGAMPYNNFGQGVGFYGLSGARAQPATGRLVFVTDEPKPIIDCGGYGATYALNVNDGTGWKAVIDSSIVAGAGNNWIGNVAFAGGAAGGLNPVQLDFSQVGGRKKRIFEIVMFGDMAVWHVGITAASTYFDPPASKPILWFCDSLGSTVSRGYMKDSYVNVLMDTMGWRDVWQLGEGGTGYIATSGGAGRTHKQKVQNAALMPQLANPGLIVFQASVNDNNLAGIQAAASDAITTAMSLFPGVPIVSIGPTAGNNASSQAQAVANDQAVAAAVASINSPLLAPHVLTMADPYGQAITGTGNSDAPAGNGNSDFIFNNSDGLHFSIGGHLIWGRDRIPAGLINALRYMVFAAA